MALYFSNTTANAMLDVIATRVDAGSGPGKINVYSGTMPINAETALSGNTLLAELICSDPSAAPATGRTLTLNPITQDSSANASGIASFFRLVDSTGAVVIQGDVTVSGGGGALEMNTTNIVAGGPIQITASSYSLA